MKAPAKIFALGTILCAQQTLAQTVVLANLQTINGSPAQIVAEVAAPGPMGQSFNNVRVRVSSGDYAIKATGGGESVLPRHCDEERATSLPAPQHANQYNPAGLCSCRKGLVSQTRLILILVSSDLL